MPSATEPQNSARKKMGVTEIHLIPWDPESPDHIQRLIQQRIACGWNEEMVESKWRDQQRLGHKSIHWIVLSDSNASKETLEQKHITAFPSESKLVQDTALTIGGKPRSTPYIPPFTPLGHISLDSQAADASGGASSYDVDDAYRLTTFYVSRELQGTGLGRAAMDALESMATSPPLSAKTIVLATAADEYEGRAEKHEALGRKLPEYSIAEWYGRRGYVVYKHLDAAWWEEDSTGKKWPVTAVFMKKDIK